MYGTAMMGLLGGGIGLLTRSLDFGDGNNRGLTIAASDFNYSALNKDKCAFAGTVYFRNLSSTRQIIRKSPDSSDSEFGLSVSPTGGVTFFVYSGTPGASWYLTSNNSVISAGGWYSYLIYYDRNNATTNNRIRMWINGTERTERTNYNAPTGSISSRSGAANVTYGYSAAAGGGEINGLLYSPAVFSNYLPTTSEIFNGSAGKVKNMTGITGLHSLLDTLGGVVTHDNQLAAAWTNTNGVIASVSLP